jgi:hypothetical protein
MDLLREWEVEAAVELSTGDMDDARDDAEAVWDEPPLRVLVDILVWVVSSAGMMSWFAGSDC